MFYFTFRHTNRLWLSTHALTAMRAAAVRATVICRLAGRYWQHILVDKTALVCYYVIVMKLTQTLKTKYYTYQPGDFLPVYQDGQLANKREFHAYRLGWIVKHRHAAVYQFTHYAG